MSDSIFRSRTFWFNAISGIILVLAMPEVTNLLSPAVMRFVPAVIAVSNIVLRRFTDTRVTFTGTGDGTVKPSRFTGAD